MALFRFFNSALFILLIFVMASNNLWAQDPQQQDPQQSQAQENRARDVLERLKDLGGALAEKQDQRTALEEKLAESPGDVEIQKLLEELNTAILSLSSDFETIATGGNNLADFFQPKDTKADMRADMEEITQPLLDSLKEATARPRAMEQQRSQVARLKARLELVDKVLANMESLENEPLTEAALKRFNDLETAWQQHHEDVKRDLDVATFTLNDMMNNHVPMSTALSRGVSSFVKGRGKNIVMALVVGFLLAIFMHFCVRMFSRRTSQLEGRNKVGARLLLYSFHLLTGVISICGVLVVLYVQGDWILLGVALIVMLGLVLKLKDWLPQFLTETRILLNLGSVREGERVVYHGLPWHVTSISIGSTLTNPLLRGGSLRLPLSEMRKLISRPEGENEPWFPCKEGDWIFLPDGIHAKVMLQTPEVVHIRTAGGTIHYYDSLAFTKMRVMNFSTGSYGVIINFAIDMRHAAICTEKRVQEIFDRAIRAKFSGLRAGEYLLNTLIEFKEPSLNALNYLVRVDMDSGIDDDYYHVKRLTNMACVEACMAEGWTLPVNQIALQQNTEPFSES